MEFILFCCFIVFGTICWLAARIEYTKKLRALNSHHKGINAQAHRRGFDSGWSIGRFTNKDASSAYIEHHRNRPPK